MSDERGLAAESAAPALAVARSGSWSRCCCGSSATQLDELTALASVRGQLPAPTEVVGRPRRAGRLDRLLEQLAAALRARAAGASPSRSLLGVPSRPADGDQPDGRSRPVFPVFETLRPIPPLAWVPLAILFWPTQELSITFVIFLGALLHRSSSTPSAAPSRSTAATCSAARSLGAGPAGLFRRVILPATLPSIVTGAAVGMGITWEVVVAAELISGGGRAAGDGGLGFLVWSAYQGGDLARVVVGMISLGSRATCPAARSGCVGDAADAVEGGAVA